MCKGKACEYDLKTLQNKLKARIQGDAKLSLPANQNLLKELSADQLCDLLNEGMAVNARRLWEMLREHWLPHGDSELSQVL